MVVQSTSFESSLFPLKVFRIESSSELARASVVVRGRAFFFVSNSSSSRVYGRSFKRKSWRQVSILRPSEFTLTNKPIKPPWLDYIIVIRTAVISQEVGLTFSHKPDCDTLTQDNSSLAGVLNLLNT